MTMRHRQDIDTIFTTFLSFEDHQATRWHDDPRLKRNLQRVLDQSQFQTTPSATDLSLYWYHQHQSTLPRLHLFAYVQEACYWAAHRLCQRLSHAPSSSLYSLSDCFQIAIAEFPQILARFDASRRASLSTYAEVAFASAIRDTLKQRREVELCSDWSLLRKISKKRLSEALAHQGLPAQQIAQYSLAWLCFRELWVAEPQTARSSQPPAELWQSVAAAYRRAKPIDQPEVSPAQLEQWLLQASKLLRAYLYPPSSSLNEPMPGPDGREKLEGLASDEDSLLSQLIAADEQRSRQQQQAQVQAHLEQALQSLKPDWQAALQLYYQQHKTQSQIAQALQCSQPSVARYLTKGRAALLTALVRWANPDLGNLNNSAPANPIEDQSEALEEWLFYHYGRT
jgi:RNA polymerase sigma factor (sigma-70 family)